MTMDQSNKRADLSIPSGLNPAAAEFSSNAILLAVERRDTCVTVSEQYVNREGSPREMQRCCVVSEFLACTI